MAALDFPSGPTVGQIYTANGKSWRWDGTSWLSITGDVDPSFAYVTSLIHCDEAIAVSGGGCNILDRVNPTFALTLGSSCSHSNAHTRFGALSFVAGGTQGVYGYSGGYSGFAGFAFGAGDFTMEIQYYVSNASQNGVLIDTRPNGNTSLANCCYFNTDVNGVIGYHNSVSGITSPIGTLVANNWYHLRYDRVSGVGRLGMNGVSLGTMVDTVNYSNSGLSFFANSSGTVRIVGYMSEFRVTKGLSRGLGVQMARWPDR